VRRGGFPRIDEAYVCIWNPRNDDDDRFAF
jgi:hypothetical protein